MTVSKVLKKCCSLNSEKQASKRIEGDCISSIITQLSIIKFHVISWCGNFVERQFLQSFHTRKLGEITVFYTVHGTESQRAATFQTQIKTCIALVCTRPPPLSAGEGGG